MKKIISVMMVIVLFLTFAGCKKTDSNVSYNSEDETDIRHTQVDITETEKQTETLSESTEEKTTQEISAERTPLELVDFTVKDPENTSGLSTKKIAHAYGVAKNETPNDISVNSQKYFEENNFKALTLDTVSEEKVVYLTFDVGYDNGYTGIILDTLKEKNVPAAFFCTVGEMESSPESIERMINEGHIVGNHTKNHPSMDEISRTEMMQEIKAFDDYIRTNFGYSSPYFRFPKGEYSDSALDLVGSLGYTSVFWSLAYADWDVNDQKGASYAHDTVTARIHPGAVILLHAVSSDNAYALGDIIDTVRNMGYEFRSLDDYANNS